MRSSLIAFVQQQPLRSFFEPSLVHLHVRGREHPCSPSNLALPPFVAHCTRTILSIPYLLFQRTGSPCSVIVTFSPSFSDRSSASAPS